MSERKRKKKSRRKGVKILKRVFLGLVCAALALGLAVPLFHVQSIQVSGTKRLSKREVLQWAQSGPYGDNGLFIWWKCKNPKVKKPPMARSIKVKFIQPWSALLQVEEKEPIGYIDYKGEALYFDGEGEAVYQTKQIFEGVSHIEGLEVEESKVALGRSLPVSDKSVFQRIVESSEYLAQNNLFPDRISCADGNITVYFGKIEARLGRRNYSRKIAQLPPILEKLAGQSPDSEGVLHLEYYEDSEKGIRFTPKAPEP